jgi:hypothetical protein
LGDLLAGRHLITLQMINQRYGQPPLVRSAGSRNPDPTAKINVLRRPGTETTAPQQDRSFSVCLAWFARANTAMAEIALQPMKLYAPLSGIVSRPFIKEGAYITKEARDQSRPATVVQLDPIHVIGQAPVAMYFQRGGGAQDTRAGKRAA